MKVATFVDIEGALAFLPGSQVDLKPIKDISPLLNKPQPMVILKMDKLRGNIVVSKEPYLKNQEKQTGQSSYLIYQKGTS